MAGVTHRGSHQPSQSETETPSCGSTSRRCDDGGSWRWRSSSPPSHPFNPAVNLEYQGNLRDTLETLHLEELAHKRRVRELNPQDWLLWDMPLAAIGIPLGTNK